MTARLVLAAAVLAALPLVLLELAGARSDAAVLSGQLPATLAGGAAGLAYVLAWFAAVLLAPILALAAALLLLSDRRTSAGASPGTPPSPRADPRP